MGGSILSKLSDLFGLSDEQAMLRVQKQDDSQAYAVLVQRWRGRIQRLCGRLTGDAHRAEDVAQEVFTKIFLHRHSYRHQGRFSTFIWRVAINACHDERRRQKRRNEYSLDKENSLGQTGIEALESADPGPSTMAVNQEQVNIVRQALMNLPEHYRSVVVMRHYEGLKFREIADVLEIAEGTVKSRMAEALSRLERALKPQLSDAAVRTIKQV